MRVVYDDGGRERAGYRGRTGDCVTRTIAIATQQPYQEIYDRINRLAGEAVARTGVPPRVTRQFLKDLGWQWTPTMAIGSGCAVHLRYRELPLGRLVVRLSRHITAVVDGVIHDVYDPQRGGQRCVYGFWSKRNGDV
jgi:hypothetical protein